MQLIKSIIFLLALSLVFPLTAQEEEKIHLEDIEITILGSYYVQDGNHSPVTGGIGTEYLENVAPSLIVVVPLDSVKTLDFSGGIDFYSSASSDNIDNPFLLQNQVSGESAKDSRIYGTVGYKKKDKKNNLTYGGSLGASLEYDVASLQFSGSIAKSSKDGNQEYALKASYYLDNWKKIYPVELRNGAVDYLPTNLRHTGTVSFTGSFILSRKLQGSVSTDFVLQQGLLSTPFHRVYFAGSDRAVVEQLPATRVKFPLGLRLNYSVNDWLILRSHYRFYYDSWSVLGHTATVELPIKVGQSVRFYPFYRYHTQTAATYFKPNAEHTEAAEFYTSDFDLSALSSHKYGLGISFTPLFGITRLKTGEKVALFKGIDLRYARYSRSDGLNADMGTVSMRFALQR